MRPLGWLLLVVCGCSQEGVAPADATSRSPVDAAPRHVDEPEGHEALPTRVTLSPQVIADAGIKTAPVTMKALPSTVDLTGEIIADPDRSARIATRVPGRIVEVHFKDYARVPKGAVLAVIESPELARSRAAYAAAQAKASAARQNAERLRRVAEKGLAAGQEVATAEAEAKAVEAEARASKQTLAAFGPSAFDTSKDAARLELRSPIAGFALSRDAIQGQTVGADHVIATVADLDRVYFAARLFEKDLAKVRVGVRVEVRLNAYPNEVFLGDVVTIGHQLDAKARTVLARVALANRRDLLKVGLFGVAHVEVPDGEERAPRPAVPLSALTRITERDVVFVRQPDGHFEVHPVTIGRTAAGQAEIVTGLRAGEEVVVDGVFTLKSAVLKRSFGEED